MKKRLKPLLLIIGALLLVTATVVGTLAFLTAEKNVVNTFTIGKVEIKLDEGEVGTDGVTVDTGKRVTYQANSYLLVPGAERVKDPRVTILADSEAAYVRVLVTMHNASAVKAIVNNSVHGFGGDYKKLFGVVTDSATGTVTYGQFGEGWTLYGAPVEDTTANTLTLELRHDKTTKSATNYTLKNVFTYIKLPGTLTSTEMASLNGDMNTANDDFKITVVAHAIQAEGFDNADEAWTAFEEQVARENASTNP